MSKTLELTDDLHERLVEAAAKRGTTPTGWLELMLPLPNGGPQTLYDEVKDLIGSFDSRESGGLREIPNDPFFNGLLQKQREGHL